MATEGNTDATSGTEKTQMNVKAPTELVERIEKRAARQYEGNRSEAIRSLLEKGLVYDGEVRDLSDEIGEREVKITELRNQLQERGVSRDIEKKVDRLAESVDDQRHAADAPFLVKWVRWYRSEKERGDDPIKALKP